MIGYAWRIARRGLCSYTFLSFFLTLAILIPRPRPNLLLPCPQQPFEAVLPFLKQITEFLEKLLTWPRSKFNYGWFDLELFGPVHFTYFYLQQHCAEIFSLTPSVLSSLCPLSIRFSLRKVHRRLQPVVPCPHVNLVLIKIHAFGACTFLKTWI